MLRAESRAGLNRLKKRSRHNESDLFFTFFRNNPYPMWIFDHQTLEFLDVNTAAVRKYGYSRSEFLQMKITDIRPKEQIPKLLAGIRPFRLEAGRITDRQHVTKDGCLIDVEIIASQLYFKGRPAVVVEVQDITEQKQAGESLCETAIVEERNRIARDLHDTLAQGLNGILLQLQAAEDVLMESPGQAARNIRLARTLARQSLKAVRQTVWKIHPRLSNESGLSSIFKRMSVRFKRLGVPIYYSLEGQPRVLPNEIENHLLWITQEALTNAMKYAKATRLDLSLSFQRRKVQITIKDNGKGFFPDLRRKGFGLISIQERADRIGAKVSFSSKRREGSKIVVSLPV